MSRFILSLGFLLAALPIASHAEATPPEYTLVIKDHRFDPKELTVPVGMKIKLIVDNQDASPEEFESPSLNREKVVAGNSKITLLIGPLTPGRYPFVGEYNEKTARGVVIAR